MLPSYSRIRERKGAGSSQHRWCIPSLMLGRTNADPNCAPRLLHPHMNLINSNILYIRGGAMCDVLAYPRTTGGCDASRVARRNFIFIFNNFYLFYFFYLLLFFFSFCNLVYRHHWHVRKMPRGRCIVPISGYESCDNIRTLNYKLQRYHL